VLLFVVTLGLVGTTPASAKSGPTAAQAIPFTAATVTRTPDGYDISWKAPTRTGMVKVYAGTDPAEVGTANEVGSGSSTGTIHVTGLEAAPRWYFELVPARGGPLVTADHSLGLASVPNFRDIGGYRTRNGEWVKVGQLYRSDGLDAITDADLATLQALGIKLVCDLRTNGERESKPDREIPGATNEQIDVTGQDKLTAEITSAITSGDEAEQERLLGNGKGRKLLVDGGRALVSDPTPLAAYRVMFDRIENSANRPTVMHCSGGKDRTGWASAAILMALGVPQATVMHDYLLSNRYLEAKNEKTLAQTGALIDRALLEPVLTVRKDYLDASFDEVDAEYGTFDKYLAAIGVTKADKKGLRRELLAD
jgi:protein-tyrosine phosphatase